jgi:hypothetical protein
MRGEKRQPAGGPTAESVSSASQIEAADRLAETLVVAFGQCEMAGRPLTELQKIDILSSALAVFDGYRAELESRLSFEQTLLEFRRGANGTGTRRSGAAS